MQTFNLDMVMFFSTTTTIFFLQIYKLDFLKQSCFQRSTKGDLQPHTLKSFMHTISQAQNPSYAYLDTNLGAQVCLPLTSVSSLFPSVLIFTKQRTLLWPRAEFREPQQEEMPLLSAVSSFKVLSWAIVLLTNTKMASKKYRLILGQKEISLFKQARHIMS